MKEQLKERIERIATELEDEVTSMWSEGKISGDEAIASRHFIEKFKTLLTD